MASINEKYQSRSVYSIRVNEELVETARQTGIPLSNLIETCLTYFVTLSDEERIRFLVKNDPDRVSASEIKKPQYNYADRAIETAKQKIGSKHSDRTSNKLLIALGLTLLLAILFPGQQIDS